MPDYIDALLATTQVSGSRVAMPSYEDVGDIGALQAVGDIGEEIAGLQAIGAIDEVGARKLRRHVASMKAALGPTPAAGAWDARRSPAFQRSARDTERRAPLGFTEDVSGAKFWTLPAVLGSTTTMRGKVSRVAHVNRLLIVPSAPGAIIQSLMVGDEEQLLASGVPVELYGPTALTDVEPDNFSPLGPALDFIVVLQNTTAGSITGTIGCKASCKR